MRTVLNPYIYSQFPRQTEGQLCCQPFLTPGLRAEPLSVAEVYNSTHNTTHMLEVLCETRKLNDNLFKKKLQMP